MYNMDKDTYSCDYCGFEMLWDATDQSHGDMWGCEKCEREFCSKCFEDRYGHKAFRDMLRESDKVLCPDCYKEEHA